MISLLRERNFSLLWFGGLISFIGDWVLIVALPLYIYTLTDSVLATGAAFIATTLPHIALGSVAGVYVDRWDRRRTLVLTNILRAVFLLPLLLVNSADTVWIAYIVVLLTHTTRQFSAPAENALLPRLVGEDKLVPANALNALNNNLARLIGPAIGGVVFATFGFAASVLVDIASFMIAGTMLALIVAPKSVTKVQPEGDGETKQAVWREWLDGLRVMRSNHIVASLFIVLCINMLGEGMLSVLFAPWVKDVLGGGATELGWVLSAQAVGGLLGGLLISRVGKAIPPWQLVALGFVALGVIDFLIFNTPVLVGSLLLFALVGLPIAGLQVGAQTLFQKNVADRYMGRVMGAFGTTSALALLVGMLFATLAGDTLPIVPVLSAVALLDIAAGIAAFRLLRPSSTSVTPAQDDATSPVTERQVPGLVGNTTSD